MARARPFLKYSADVSGSPGREVTARLGVLDRYRTTMELPQAAFVVSQSATTAERRGGLP
jgi:hypothetical protein